ncbi:MAG: NADH-quinone oxidoreductase subunit M [Candidatus Eremiobacteraeota bacterium]|nr:NADH-quinone oxidoreductase subunit M [Candidatus Eremiobacteraeota bacterium]
MIVALVLGPIVAGFVMYAFPKKGSTARWFAVAIAAASLVIVWLAAEAPDEAAHWLSRPFSAAFHFGIGGVSFWLALLLALCTVCALLASNVARLRDFAALLLILEGSMMGLFLARDLLVFAVFWDLMLIPVFLLLLGWGHHPATAWRYIIYNFAGGLTLLLATAAFGVAFGSTDVIGKAGLAHLGNVWQPWIFAGFAFSFLIKTPVWPLHTWMPATYADSPGPLAAIIGAVQSKAGLYGFIAIGMGLLPESMRAAAPLMFVLGLIALVYGALIALVQTDAKKIVAYSSLSHLGLILLAIFSFNPVTLRGAIVYIVAHGLFSAALFLVIDFVEQREETRSLLRMGGLGSHNPKLAGALTIAALAALGLPGLAGFAGELMILSGLYAAGDVWPALIALIPIVLAAAYMLRLFQDIMNGPPVADLPERRDMTLIEGIALAPLVLAMVLVGVDPHPLTTFSDQSYSVNPVMVRK